MPRARQNARITDISKATLEIEELVRLPDEIPELTKAREASMFKVVTGSGAVVTSLEAAGGGGLKEAGAALSSAMLKGGGKGKEGGGKKDDPMADPLRRMLNDRLDGGTLDGKSEDERRAILQRREESLVQNKVLRSLNRRGLTLRELFTKLDKDDSGELDPEEFIQGIQQLEGQLSESQVPLLPLVDSRMGRDPHRPTPPPPRRLLVAIATDRKLDAAWPSLALPDPPWSTLPHPGPS